MVAMFLENPCDVKPYKSHIFSTDKMLTGRTLSFKCFNQKDEMSKNYKLIIMQLSNSFLYITALHYVTYVSYDTKVLC
jgi:hypothetical protein